MRRLLLIAGTDAGPGIAESPDTTVLRLDGAGPVGTARLAAAMDDFTREPGPGEIAVCGSLPAPTPGRHWWDGDDSESGVGFMATLRARGEAARREAERLQRLVLDAVDGLMSRPQVRRGVESGRLRVRAWVRFLETGRQLRHDPIDGWVPE